MANIKSSAKRARQSSRGTARNAGILAILKTQQKKFRAAIHQGNKEVIHLAFVALSSSLDKAAKKGVIHKNSANRKKSLIAQSLPASI